MQTNDYRNHLILNQHQVAWLLVFFVVILLASFGCGYFIGKRSVDRQSTPSSLQSELIKNVSASCNGLMQDDAKKSFSSLQ